MVEREGLYDVSVHKMLSESDLKPETVFECMLTIPGLYIKIQYLLNIK